MALDTLSLILLWGGIGVGFLVLGFCALGVYRMVNGVNIVIVRDFRKNRKFDKPIQLKMFIDSKSGSMKQGKLYKSWISIFEADTRVWELPDIASIKYGSTVFAVRGKTKDINDDNLYFYHLPEGETDYADKLSLEVNKSLSEIAQMTPEEFKMKTKNMKHMGEWLKQTFNDTWTLAHFGVEPTSKSASLPRQYKSFLINALKDERAFGTARQDLWGKLAIYLPFIMFGIGVLLFGIGAYNIDQGNQLMVQTQQAYMAQEYTWLAAQNLAIGQSLAAAHVYGYNATIAVPPAPPNLSSGLSIPQLPKTT